MLPVTGASGVTTVVGSVPSSSPQSTLSCPMSKHVLRAGSPEGGSHQAPVPSAVAHSSPQPFSVFLTVTLVMTCGPVTCRVPLSVGFPGVGSTCTLWVGTARGRVLPVLPGILGRVFKVGLSTGPERVSFD